MNDLPTLSGFRARYWKAKVHSSARGGVSMWKKPRRASSPFAGAKTRPFESLTPVSFTVVPALNAGVRSW